MRGAQRRSQILARAAAGIQKPAVHKLLPCRAIKVSPLALRIRRKRSVHIGTLLPRDSKPMEIFERRIGINSPAALGIEIFHPQRQRPARVARPYIRSPKRPRMANVQIARR